MGHEAQERNRSISSLSIINRWPAMGSTYQRVFAMTATPLNLASLSRPAAHSQQQGDMVMQQGDFRVLHSEVAAAMIDDEAQGQEQQRPVKARLVRSGPVCARGRQDRAGDRK